MKRKYGLTPVQRIERRRVAKGECWETDIDLGHVYPALKVDGKQVPIHRIMFEAVNGPTKLLVLHRCDNPRCHNPTHLFAGTHSDNIKDCWSKQRRSVDRNDVVDTFAAVLASVLSQADIAKCLGVSQPAISSALRRIGKSRGRTTSFGKNHGRGGRRRRG